jgi:myo-inositol-1(or 4)-monophosphatase
MPISPTDALCRPAQASFAGETNDLRRIHAVALEAAKAAGEVLMAGFGRSQAVDDQPAHDLKLAADRRSEAAALTILQAHFPDHEIISEEKGLLNPGAEFRWYLDPLDGTVNYFLGQPYFCTCLACYHTPQGAGAEHQGPLGQPVSGVVLAPALERCFEARPGGPALCNGQPVRPGSEKRLAEAVIGFSYGSDADTMQRMLRVAQVLALRARKVRIFGATGLDLAHVACGGLSGLVQGNVRVWDFAAAKMIVEAAGGYCRTDPGDSGGWQITAAAPGIAVKLRQLVDRLGFA